ncbi:hypothetical protein G6F43_002261 [Rhizopus delemar]|nr:hypothetical protein G6F43_002261 [Rhizopus delemar]
MPEIAEVERARLRIHRQAIDYKITNVKTNPDHLVFAGKSDEDFAKSILSKTLVQTKRWGKYFVLLFDEGPHIVAHLGMTGGIRFEHEEKEWPPRFWKLLITFEDPATGKIVNFGFKDPRRLSKLRLIDGDPMKVEPISKLGFDPVLNMPSFEEFSGLVCKRAVPTKTLLLDQSFSAGVGNWVADEILFQAKIHPAQLSNTLTKEELLSLYDKTKYVCETAVAVEADESKFPEDWLMKYRWNKGRGPGKGVLPDGQILKFETIGGRTSAFSPVRQILRRTNMTKTKVIKKTATKKAKPVAKMEKESLDEIEKAETTTVIISRTRNVSKYNLRQINLNQ